MNVNYYKLYHNYFLCSLILASFIEGYGKTVSYKTITIVIPLIFTDEISQKLENGNINSSFYSLIAKNYNIDIDNEIKIRLKLTNESIIFGVNKGYFQLSNNSFIIGDNFNNKYKNKTIKKMLKSSRILGTILGKIKDEKEIYYHLSKY